MEKDIQKAIGDIAIIKGIIEETQKDFSKISAFFVWIGIINLMKFVAEQLAYYFRDVNGYNSGISVLFIRIAQILPLIAYIICFIFFYNRIKESSNTISKGILQVWGSVLIGAQILEFLYMFLIPTGNSEAIRILWRSKELIIILPIMVILLVTGVLTQRKVITITTGIYSVIYFVFFTGMKEIRYGIWGGYGTLVSISSISIRIVMTAGMIVLGLFLRRGVSKNGDKFNTRDISIET